MTTATPKPPITPEGLDDRRNALRAVFDNAFLDYTHRTGSAPSSIVMHPADWLVMQALFLPSDIHTAIGNGLLPFDVAKDLAERVPHDHVVAFCVRVYWDASGVLPLGDFDFRDSGGGPTRVTDRWIDLP